MTLQHILGWILILLPIVSVNIFALFSDDAADKAFALTVNFVVGILMVITGIYLINI